MNRYGYAKDYDKGSENKKGGHVEPYSFENEED
jgi:hypothetical protein